MARVTEQQLRDAVQDSITLSEVARKLGKQPKGGNVSAIANKCKLYGIDTSHLRGQSWAKGTTRISQPQQDERVFVYGGTGPHKQILIKERGHACERCGNDSWLGEVITLELDHVDGDRQNNVRDNLQLLCPNCHSYTPTWRGRNAKPSNRVTDEVLRSALAANPTIRRALLSVGMTPKGANYKRAELVLDKMYAHQELNDAPIEVQGNESDLSPFSKDELSVLLWQYPTTHIATMYSMSDNGVARWAKKWGLAKPPRGYWQKLRVV